MICQQIENNNCLCCMIVTKIEFNESQPELSREKKKKKKTEPTVHLLCTAPLNVMMQPLHVLQHHGEC